MARLSVAPKSPAAIGSKIRHREQGHRCSRQYGCSETVATRVRLTYQQEGTPCGIQNCEIQNRELQNWSESSQPKRPRTERALPSNSPFVVVS
jgi:hypothetical protein